MAWRILLGVSIAGSFALAYVIPMTPLARFVFAGLLFALISRSVFAVATRTRLDASDHQDDEAPRAVTVRHVAEASDVRKGEA
jgi:hypothetical protein